MTPDQLVAAATTLRAAASTTEVQADALVVVATVTLTEAAWASVLAVSVREQLDGGPGAASARLRAAAAVMRALATELEERAVVRQASIDAAAERASQADTGTVAPVTPTGTRPSAELPVGVR